MFTKALSAIGNKLKAASEAGETFVLIRNIFISFFGRAINLLSNVIAIPLAVHSIGTQDYGMVAIAISLSSFFAFADFGLGSALVNDLSQAHATDDKPAQRKAISEVWFILWGFCLLILLGYGLYSLIQPHVGQASLHPAVLSIIVIFAALGIPMAITQRVYFSFREGAAAQFWMTLARVSLVLACVYCYFFAANVVAFVFAFIAVPCLVFVASTLYLFVFDKPDLRPTLQNFAPDHAFSKLKVGIVFTVLQVCTFMETGLDPVIIGHFFTPETVSKVDLAFRPFSYVPALLSIGLGPLWPSLTSSIAKGDMAWVRKTTRLSYLVTWGLAGATSILLFIFIKPILILWVDYKFDLDYLMILFIALFTVLQAVGLLQLMLMNAFDLVKQSALISVIFLLLIFPLKIFLISLFGPALGYAALCVWYLLKLGAAHYFIHQKVRTL